MILNITCFSFDSEIQHGCYDQFFLMLKFLNLLWNHTWDEDNYRTPSNLPKGKAKLISQQTDKISQQPENWENRNGPDLVQAFPKKSWVESDFTAPLFCRNVPYLTLLNSFVFVHRKSKMDTDAGQIKKSISSQKLDIWLNPNWIWVNVGWFLKNISCFSDNQKYKMIMRINLTWNPKGKTLHNYSYLKQLKHL
jgi:hypothetical protein